ncbi:MAG: flap endonuclease [Pseudonocardiaceae bacterium]|nr:flap endonuclease [Pseudonocardiaceae bacterium]
MDRPLLLLDAASLYFRAYFGVPDTVTAPDGTPVNAVRGFADMIARLVVAHRPARLVACLDLDWRPAFRVAAMPSYKAHRVAETHGQAPDEEAVPDTLAPQLPVILEVLAAAGVATAGAEGYEADDVIGTLVATEKRDPVTVVSGDRDLFQVVREEPTPVRVVYVARGLAKAEVIGPAELAARCGLPPTDTGAGYADLAALRGDPSDGLPGVPGVGEKTAATLIGRFGSVEGLLAALDDPAAALAPAVRAKLTAARDYLTAAPAVVRVATDAEVHVDRGDALPPASCDLEALAALQRRWGLGASVDRLTAALRGDQGPGAATS